MNAALAVAVGLTLGFRHATDADHIVALATLLRSRSGLRGALTLGAVWGLGHTLVVIAAGVAIIGLGLHVPEPFERVAELAVAAMLVALGLRHLRPRLGGHDHLHHDEQPPRFAARPFLIGMVHGLAGSAGAALLALTTIPVPALALVYLVVFGAGTVIGMMALTGLLSLPLRVAGRLPHVERRIVQVACATSIAMGVFIGLRVALGGGGA